MTEFPSCPYCRFEVRNEDAVACDACQASHHVDCWDDNGGCAVYGCVNSPKHDAADEMHPAKAAAATAVFPAASTPLEAAPHPPAAAPSVAGQKSVHGIYLAVAGILALAIVIAGVAIAVSISRGPAEPAVAASETSTADSSPEQSSSSTDDSLDAEPAPDPEPEAESAPAASSSSTSRSASTDSPGYVAQLGSFTNRSGAEELRDQLSSAGVTASILRSNNIVEFEPGYWVVYTGPFSSRSDANDSADEANANGAQGGFSRYATPR
ncbi:MAG: SPOR domain-containing protein [Solirubrobacterales bacterium]